MSKEELLQQLLKEHKRLLEQKEALGDYSNASVPRSEYEEKKRIADDLAKKRESIFNQIMELRRSSDGKKKKGKSKKGKKSKSKKGKNSKGKSRKVKSKRNSQKS
jgi:hypothetical protein